MTTFTNTRERREHFLKLAADCRTRAQQWLNDAEIAELNAAILQKVLIAERQAFREAKDIKFTRLMAEPIFASENVDYKLTRQLDV